MNLKDKVAYRKLSSAKNLRQAVKDVWVTEIAYCETLVFSMSRHIQTVIDTDTVIKFQIVLYYAFGEINLYNLV